MSNGPQFNEKQQAILDALEDRYARRFETPSIVSTGDEDERPPISSYAPEIQRIFSGDGFKQAYDDTQMEAMRKMLEDNDMDADSFFRNDPEADMLKVMQATNYQNYESRLKRYNEEGRFTTEEAKLKAIEDLNKRYSSMFEANMIYPKLGTKVAELVPKSVMEDDYRRADFERAILNEYGLKFDLDSSEMIGDVYSEGRPVLNELRKTRYRISDAGVELTKSTVDVMSGLARLIGGAIYDEEDLYTEGEINEMYQKRKEAGETQTASEAGQSFMSSFDLDDGLFWDAIYSTEAREDWYRSHKSANTVDFQQISDGSDADLSQLWRAGTDQLVQSAPLIADVMAGRAIAKAALKGVTKGVTKRATSRYVARASGRYANPATGRFMSKKSVDQINKRAASINRVINGTGGFIAADALLSASIHADNVGQEWYDNLTPQQRFAYLASESSAETLSAIVLEGIVVKGFGRAKNALGHGGFKAQKKFIQELGKNVAESMFVGAIAEASAEVGTAAWQYWNEVQAKKATDPNAVGWESEVFLDRIMDAGRAGAALGVMGGLFGGLTGGAASAYISTRHPLSVEADKEVKKAAQDVVNAPNSEARKVAAERFEKIVQKHAGAKSSLTRAYYRLSQQNPEAFTRLTEIQREINLAVQRFKKSEDAEQQETQKRELERLVQEKQQIEDEIAKEAGANSFDDIISEEVERLGEERKEKLDSLNERKRNSPEAEAERLSQQELDEQRTSMEAAEEMNSPEQNADDDVQDKEGETSEDAQARREAAQDNSLEGDADNQFAPSIDEDADVSEAVKSKYRDVVSTVNNLMKGFKKFGIKVVMHKTSDSYFKATGKTKSAGVFTRDKATKTIHFDLERMANRQEAKGLEGVYNTPVHEFLHLAFTTADVATLNQYKKELLALARSVGLGKQAQDIFDAVAETYAGESETDLINEQITNALERLINALPESRKPGFLERAFRAFLRVFGLEKSVMGEAVTSTDFLDFISQFKEARDKGVEFKREEIPLDETAESESRDIGMRQPSKAYPDLIQKEVFFTYSFINKYGGLLQYQGSVKVNDYWHFRNWWVKQTGNGKKANNMIGFVYKDAQGNFKTINPPKPKRDRETGEIIDMEPTLKSPDQRKIESNQASIDAKARIRDRESATNALVSAISEIGGVLKRLSGDRKTEFFLNQQGKEVEEKSGLPVVYSEKIFIEGLRNLQYENQFEGALRNAMADFEFLVPKSQEGKFEYSLVDNGDGTVTLEVHSDSKISIDPQSINEGDSFSGSVEMESIDLKPLSESKKETLFDIIGRRLDSLKLSEIQGIRVVIAFYDPTSGERSGVGADYPRGYLFSQSEEESAEKTFQRIEEAAIQNHRKILKEAEKFGKSSEEYKKVLNSVRFVDENGNITYRGRILLTTGFMSEGSLIGNKDFIGESFDLYRDYYKKLEDVFGEKEAQKIFVQSFNTFLSKSLSAAQKTLISNISSSFDLYGKEGFRSVRISELPGRTKRLALPQTADAVFELMDSIRDSQTKGITAFRNKKDIVRKMMTDTEGGFSNLVSSTVDSTMAMDESIGDISIKDQAPRITDVKNSLKNKGVVIEESELSQKAIYHKIFEYELSEEKTLEGKTALSLSNAEVGKNEAEGREELPFPWYVKVKEGSEGGLIGEYVSEEEVEVLDMIRNYKFKGETTSRKKPRIEKPIGEEETSLKEEVSISENKLRDWDKENMSEELSELLKELSSLRNTLSDKNSSDKDKRKAEKRINQILNPRASTESFKKIQEREALVNSLDISKKDLSSFYSSVRKMQDAPIEGELSMSDPDNSTRTQEQESIDIGLNPDNQSDLPFEPNRLDSFQAFMARVDQLFANKYANVFSLQKAIEKAKRAVVDISQDFINAETLMYGKTANDLEKLDEKVKAISQEMKEKGLDSDDVSQFLIARHAKERNAVIAERTEGKNESGSGMSDMEADEIMASLSPEKRAALESIAAKVDAITADTRKTMVKFGLESQETIDAFEQMFNNYVPLGGLSSDEMSADTSMYPTGGAGMSIYGDTTRRARGRKSQANNVLAQAIAQNAAVHAKARKNEALSSLYNLVEANPNTKVWKISKEVPFDAQSAVGVRVNGEQKFIVFTNADHAKALKNMGVEKLDLFSKIMRSFSGFLRRSFTTANPEFIISNFARDIQSALFNAMAEADIPGGQIQSKYIATKIIERVKQTLPALLKGAVGKDLDPEMAAYFEEFKEDGGQTGWGFVKDVGTIAAEIEAEVNEKSKAKKAAEWARKNSIDIVENVNDAFENSIRLAAYIEARKAGTSREKAAELAKNITVNFNRSGELGAVANAWYMFFNASVQGTVRLARSLGTLKDIRKPNGELEAWHNRLNAAQKMAFGLSLTTGMLTAINIAMSDEDEDGVLFYNKIPDYEKERNLIIMYDGQNYLKIPLPYGFNVFANMGSAMAEVAGGQREMTDAGMFLLNSAFSSFSPVSFGQSKDAAKYLAKGATPTIFKPLVDIAVNESYFGSSVYKEQFPVGAPKPEAEMSFRAPEGVRSFFQWMNEATGGSEFVPGKVDFNPDKFWYGFEYYIGGAGQFVTRTVGTGRDTYEMIKEGEKVPMKANDFPFLRKLYGEFSKYYDSDVYVENANLVSQLYKERQEADNKNDKRYRGIMKLEAERKKTEKQIKRLRELRKEARDIKNYVERQNRIYELYEKERSLLMQFNKQYEKLRGED